MKTIEVKKIIKALNASDGAGVKLKRSIGTPEADYIDPFLMLDEFGSENKDDYIAGFPPHPHRGIETVTYMLNGEFEHQDSTGAKGIMTSGDVYDKTGFLRHFSFCSIFWCFTFFHVPFWKTPKRLWIVYILTFFVFNQ